MEASPENASDVVPFSTGRFLVQLALWTTVCLMGAFDIPLKSLPMLLFFFLSSYRTAADAVQELRQPMSRSALIAVAVFVIALISFVLWSVTHDVPGVSDLSEANRVPLWSGMWVVVVALLFWRLRRSR